MSDKKTMNEELAMEYSPILGVTYGLVNVTENEDSEERDELHDFDLVMNLMVGKGLRLRLCTSDLQQYRRFDSFLPNEPQYKIFSPCAGVICVQAVG
jgi:hypothetical protein